MFPHNQRQQQQQKISAGGGGGSGFGLEDDDHDERDGVLRILDPTGAAGAHDDVHAFRDDDYDGDDDDEGFASVVNSRRRRQQQHRQVQRRRRLCAVAGIVAVVAIAILAAVVTTTSKSNPSRTDGNALDAGDAKQQSPQSSVTGASDNPQQVSGEAPAADADDDDDTKDDDDAGASYPAVADDDDSEDDDDAALSSVFVMPDASALESYCGYSLTLSEGYGACEVHCAPSACCRIPSGVEGSCLNDQAYACQVYRDHCSVLDNRPAQQNAEPDYSENWQDKSNVESPNGNNYGAPSRSSNPNLPNDDHMTDDAEYQYKHIAAAPDDIESVCTMEAMSASLDGLRACAKCCVNAYCCYDASPYDCRDKQPHCARYVEPCTRLQAKLQEP
jgi:hypothetical protein